MVRSSTAACCLALLLAMGNAVTRADDAVVGNGTPASCTDAAINSAINILYPGALFSGGTLSFNCGPNPHTILISSQKGLTDATTVDGGGLITLDGQNLTRLFIVTGAQSRVELHRIVLRGGRAMGSFGGAVYVANETYLGVFDSILRDNIAEITGGAIAAEPGSSVSITRSSLISNTGQSGGAIAASGGLTLTDSLIALNNATLDQGGGVQHWFGDIDIVNTRFEFNDGINGGGLLLRGSFATLTNATFRDNVATTRGGAIALYEGAFAFGSSLVFERNRAAQGGAVHLGGVDLGSPQSNPTSLAATFIFDGARFSDNHADQFGTLPRHGGAIYSFGLPSDHDGSIASVFLDSVAFTGNSAVRGGGVYSQGLFEAVATRFEGNAAQLGAGLYLAPPCFLNCPPDTSALAQLTEVTFQGNVASADGGGLYNELGLPLFTDVNFIENSAARGGGMATYGYLYDQSRFTMLRNVAANAGGGIHFEPVSGEFIGGDFVNATFSGNSVTSPTGRGGDLHLDTTGSNSLVMLSLYHTTLIGGSAAVGKSIFHAGNIDNLLEIESSLIQADPVSAAATCDGGRSIDSDGGNFMPASCDANVGASNDVVIGVNFDLRLGALTRDDEFLWSHVPAGNSPVLNTVGCSVLGQDPRPFDQRARATGINGQCDAGAIERQLLEGPTASLLFANSFE